MGLIGNSNEEKIWNYLKSKNINDFGCAGVMGNIYAESALKSDNLQSTGNKKLNMTDEEYCLVVDNGTYTNFINDAIGWGICQWTYHTRKKALYEFAKSQNKSIGDLSMQLDFLYKELSENYKSVLNVLKTATSVLQASNAVLLKYEKPADQSINAQNRRASYSQKYYDKYAKPNTTHESGGDSMKIKVNDIINLFKKMYQEHWSYIWGSAKTGCVDCSGAFVYAYKQLNGSYIYHGSNKIAREYVGELQPISNAKAGWAAFKWKKDGAPDSYTDGKGNFYHIGLVDETGKYVLHAKGTNSGFCRDKISTWHYVAPLNEVDYNNTTTEETNADVLYKAKVITESGSLNLRIKANGAIICTIPRNTTIDVLNDDNNDWWKVRYNGKVGYVSTKYLSYDKPAKIEETVEVNDDNGIIGNFNVGDAVKLSNGAIYTSGKSIPSWVFNKVLYIRKLRNDSAIISTLKTGAVTGTVLLKYLTKTNVNDNGFAPYNVMVTTDTLRIRKGAGTNYDIVGAIRDRGTYTVVEESDGVGATKWLRLESNIGWIASDYTEKV